MYYCFEIKRLPKLSASRWLDESSFGERGSGAPAEKYLRQKVIGRPQSGREN